MSTVNPPAAMSDKTNLHSSNKPKPIQLPQHTMQPLPLPTLSYSPIEPMYINSQRRLSAVHTLTPDGTTTYTTTSPNSSSINFNTQLSIQTPISNVFQYTNNVQPNNSQLSPNRQSALLVDQSLNYFTLQSSPIYTNAMSTSVNYMASTPLDQSQQYPSFPSRHSPQHHNKSKSVPQYYATQYYESQSFMLQQPQQQIYNDITAQYTTQLQQQQAKPNRQRSQHTLLGYDGNNSTNNNRTQSIEQQYNYNVAHAASNVNTLAPQQAFVTNSLLDRQSSWSQLITSDLNLPNEPFQSRANSAQQMNSNIQNTNSKLPPLPVVKSLKVKVPDNIIHTIKHESSTDSSHNHPGSVLSPPMDAALATLNINSPLPRTTHSDAEQSPNDSSDSVIKHSVGTTPTVTGPPYQCEYCQREFTRNSNLTRHKRIHGSDKRFQCSQCDKHFMEKHHLAAHERTHTGEKPYQCKVCSRTFTDRSNCTRHERTHNSNVMTADHVYNDNQQTFNPRSQSHDIMEQYNDIDTDSMFNHVADTLHTNHHNVMTKSHSTSNLASYHNINSNSNKQPKKRKQKVTVPLADSDTAVDQLTDVMSPTKRNHTDVLNAAGFTSIITSSTAADTNNNKLHTPDKCDGNNQFLLPRNSLVHTALQRRGSTDILQSPLQRNSLIFSSPFSMLPQPNHNYHQVNHSLMSPLNDHNSVLNSQQFTPSTFMIRIEQNDDNDELVAISHIPQSTLKSTHLSFEEPHINA